MERRIPMTTVTVGLLVRAYLPPVLVVLAFYLGVSQVVTPFGGSFTGDAIHALPLLLVAAAVFTLLLIALLYIRLFVLRGSQTVAQSLRSWITGTPWIEMFALRIPLSVAVMFTTQRIFVSYKPLIPDIVPFQWDHTFTVLDQVLFAGWHGWEVTHALFPGVTPIVFFETCYTIWFFTMFAGVFWAAKMPLDSPLRLGFILSFVVSWVLGGTVIATLFSSAGPVYVERLFDDPVFRPLTDHFTALNAQRELSFLKTIEYLWQGQIDPDTPALGISAFPSMHLCMATLVALFAFQISRLIGWIMWGFMVIVFIASIHLGWHYAVDSLAGIVIAWAIWWVSVRFASWWLRPVSPLPRTAATQTP